VFRLDTGGTTVGTGVHEVVGLARRVGTTDVVITSGGETLNIPVTVSTAASTTVP
jgi:hypothetical protein